MLDLHKREFCCGIWYSRRLKRWIWRSKCGYQVETTDLVPHAVICSWQKKVPTAPVSWYVVRPWSFSQFWGDSWPTNAGSPPLLVVKPWAHAQSFEPFDQLGISAKCRWFYLKHSCQMDGVSLWNRSFFYLKTGSTIFIYIFVWKATEPERTQVTEISRENTGGTVCSEYKLYKQRIPFHDVPCVFNTQKNHKTGWKTKLSFIFCCCHKPSVNSHQPSKEDPIRQHPTNTKLLQSEAFFPSVLFGWNLMRLYTFCINHLTGPIHYLNPGDFHGPPIFFSKKLHPSSLPRGHALRPVATKPWQKGGWIRL